MPRSLTGRFAALDRQASAMLVRGDYRIAEKLFSLILDTIREIEDRDHKHFHKGTYLYSHGLSLVLQGEFARGLNSLLLAYVEDALNVMPGQEFEVDDGLVARTLRKLFHVAEAHLDRVKEIARGLKAEQLKVRDPEEIIDAFFRESRIPRDSVLHLCDPKPTFQDINNRLIMELSPEARNALDEAMSETEEVLLQRATSIAKERGRAGRITEGDVREAIRQLEQGTIGR